MKRKICGWLFAAYCAVMVCLLFGREQTTWQQAVENVNLIPFHTVFLFLRLLTGDYGPILYRDAVVNLVGNVIMFLPLGFFPPNLSKNFRPLRKCLLRGTVIIVCVELTQLFLKVGSCDVDDLILNVFGIVLGYGMYCLTSTGKSKK